MGHPNVHERRTCPQCGQTNVTAYHYSHAHGVRVTELFAVFSHSDYRCKGCRVSFQNHGLAYKHVAKTGICPTLLNAAANKAPPAAANKAPPAAAGLAERKPSILCLVCNVLRTVVFRK